MIHHLNFQVPQGLARDCAAFYELLGFARVTPPPALADRAIWLEHDGFEIHLQFRSADGAEVKVAGGSGPGHAAFVIADYTAVTAALELAGVELQPRAAHWGSPRCYVRDPAGNRLELMETAPIVAGANYEASRDREA
ncbi:MAG: VOC family protein [Solirubrobacterales bacterium]